jgi:hypothetical protein
MVAAIDWKPVAIAAGPCIVAVKARIGNGSVH